MAETLTINKLQLTLAGTLENDNAIAPQKANLSFTKEIELDTGAAADSVNAIYMAQLTLAATTAANLDLKGSLTNPLGTAVTFSKVRVIIVYLHAGTNMGPLLVGGHATAALATMFTSADTLDNDQPKIRVRNGASGGLLVLTATDVTGLAVTATTDDILTIYNEGSATCTYDIIILGEA